MESLLAHCVSTFEGSGPLLAAFFLGGLTGGFTHCLAMCGPFVACERMCHSSTCKKAAGATALNYHLGRFTTYSILGFFAAFIGKQLMAFAWWPTFSAIMLAGAGALFLLSCTQHFKFGKLTFARGVLLGFMPCGLLYAALMMAATLGTPWLGAAAMALFTLGTIPALIIASLGAEYISRKWQQAMQQAGRVVMAFNGLSLLVLAVNIVR